MQNNGPGYVSVSLGTRNAKLLIKIMSIKIVVHYIVVYGEPKIASEGPEAAGETRAIAKR